MSRVLLGDVAKERRETLKSSKDGYPIVGLEHLTPEEITLTAWDEGKENTFSKLFREGDILFGRRRAYLKKAAVAPFDGICSGDITVIESIPERILPELLPFIIQNDALFNYAVGKSAGSLSPRVKWENLKNYEFELPDMGKQRELAKILWTIDTTKKTYQKLLQKTDELARSQFFEMFGDLDNNSKGWPIMSLSSLFRVRSSKRVYHREQMPSGIPFLRVSDLIDRIVNGTDSCSLYISEEQYNSFKQSCLVPKEGDILVTSRGTLGLCYIVQELDKFYFQDGMISWLEKGTVSINSRYISYLFSTGSFKRQIAEVSKGTTVDYLSLEKLSSLKVMNPDYELQTQFETFVQQADKSKFELEQALAELKTTRKRIISENFG